MFSFDDSLVFQYLEVTVHLVVGAVDDADKVCDMCSIGVGKG